MTHPHERAALPPLPTPAMSYQGSVSGYAAWFTADQMQAYALAALAARAPLTDAEMLSDERIDHIADITARGMPDGIRGFCKTWGWRQFAKALLEDCGIRAATGGTQP